MTTTEPDHDPQANITNRGIQQLKPVTYDNALANMVMLLKFGTSEEAGYAIEVYRQQVCEQERDRIAKAVGALPSNGHGGWATVTREDVRAAIEGDSDE